MNKISNINLTEVEANTRYFIVNIINVQYQVCGEIRPISDSAFRVTSMLNGLHMQARDLSDYLVTDSYLQMRLFMTFLRFTDMHNAIPECVLGYGYDNYEYWWSHLHCASPPEGTRVTINPRERK